MADKIVYLVSKVTPTMQGGDLTFVDDEVLGMMLEEGWEVTTTIPNRTVGVGKKSVKATMMILKHASNNRGMTLRDEDSGEHPQQGSRNIVTLDQFGMPRSVTAVQGMMNMLDRLSRALTHSGGAGHLGSAQDHSMPGMNIVSGELVAKAFDVGVNAGMSYQDVSTCPFPPQSVPGQRWLQGYRTAERKRGDVAAPPALANAREAGVLAAKQFGEDDEVACPYPHSSPLRSAWVEGFREAGGRVE